MSAKPFTAVVTVLILGLLPAAAHGASDPTAVAASDALHGVAPPEGAVGTRFVELKVKESAEVTRVGGRFLTPSGRPASSINGVLARTGMQSTRPLFTGRATELQRQAKQLRRAGESVPDLSQWYLLTFATRSDARRAERLLAQSPAVADVEVVIEPPPLPTTPNFEPLQEYRKAPPGGIGDVGVSSVPGADGAGVTIADVEYSWNLNHEDLVHTQTSSLAVGTPCDPFASSDHGTAVLGELVASKNGFGVTGIVPEAQVRVANAARMMSGSCGWSAPQAVNTAASALAAGDVLLIEQQMYGPDNELLPLEWSTAAYDAIRTAAAQGIVVVEAAANGGVNLDDPKYGSSFPEGKADSGAIVVGASGCGGTRSRASFSNYGSRVNLQGWGSCVTTTGYGALHGTTANDTYTSGFNGTSSASPIVAGAAAAVLSAYETAHGTTMPPEELRQLLISTGSPQAAGDNGHIGPLPNLTAALLNDDPPVTPQGLSATGSRKGVRLQWDTPTDTDIASYTVYRSRSYASEFNEVATIAGSRTAFLDKGARAGVQTLYRLGTTDVGGQPSGLAGAGGVRTGPGVVQDNQATYRGGWQRTRCSCFSDRSAMTSTQARASARFVFTGSRITFISSAGPDRGGVKIFINGNLQWTSSLRDDSPQYYVDAWTKRFRTSATRTLKIVAIDRGGRTRIDVDGFAVRP